MLPPSSVTEATITTAISTASKAYSTDDAPRSSRAGGQLLNVRLVHVSRMRLMAAPRESGRPSGLRSGSDARAGLAEHARELGSERRDGHDDNDRDQGHEEAVLDRGGAALGLGHGDEADAHVVEDVVHG